MSQQQQQLVGLLIPGYPVRTDFTAIDQGKFVLTLDCPGQLSPPLAAITEIGFFLLPNVMLPAGHGLLCYWQVTAATSQPGGRPPTATGYELLGPITTHQPSAIFPTKWAEHEQLVEISNGGVPVRVTIAVSIELQDSIDNLTAHNSGGAHGALQPERRLFVAQKVALDLFKYMQSFDSGRGGPGNMLVPNNIFDRWLQRFEAKFRRDPNFFLRSQD